MGSESAFERFRFKILGSEIFVFQIKDYVFGQGIPNPSAELVGEHIVVVATTTVPVNIDMCTADANEDIRRKGGSSTDIPIAIGHYGRGSNICIAKIVPLKRKGKLGSKVVSPIAIVEYEANGAALMGVVSIPRIHLKKSTPPLRG